MKDRKKIRIHIPGGNLPPVELRNIISLANSLNADYIEPGSRQEILLDIPLSSTANGEYLLKLKALPFSFDEGTTQSKNLVSSQPVVDIYSKSSWVSEGVYLDILSGFETNPLLKINITDLEQDMFPWWGGNLNYVASDKPGFWNLIWEDNEKNLKVFPELIYTNLIQSVSRDMTQAILANKYSSAMKMSTDFKTFLQTQNQEKWKQKKFPRTEGFHRYGNKYWLGLFARDYKFPISLLESLCQISTQTQSAKLGITPWKTFLFRDIQEKDLSKWSEVLEKYRWNTRHSGLELSWFVTDHDEDAGFLKKKILKKLDSVDVFPAGFSLGIFSEGETQLTHIKVERKYRFPKLKIFGSNYSIYFSNTPWNRSSQINPVARVGTSWKAVETISNIISGKLDKLAPSEDKEKISIIPEKSKELYQCAHCLTIYDPDFGDIEQSIYPKTSWEKVPEAYQCQVCESPKSDFKLISLSAV
jgi:rubredoxin